MYDSSGPRSGGSSDLEAEGHRGVIARQRKQTTGKTAASEEPHTSMYADTRGFNKEEKRTKTGLFFLAGSLVALVVVALLCWHTLMQPNSLDEEYSKFAEDVLNKMDLREVLLGSGQRDIAVMYLLSTSDPEYIINFHFFLDIAIAQDTRCRYFIIVHEDDYKENELPELPDHADYVVHSQDCYDWGTYGWLLKQSGLVDVSKYLYFFFINSSVRGPYLTPYIRESVPWWYTFTRALSGDVRLVGSTISCEEIPLDGNDEEGHGPVRRNAFVQSHAMATDQVGLAVLLQAPDVLSCHDGMWPALYYSETGASAMILDAGYNIACLMIRYQGVDFRDQANWGCNGRMAPTSEHSYDGITLEPYEAVFIKVRSTLVLQHVTGAAAAAKYDEWMQAVNVSDRVLPNFFVGQSSFFMLSKILERVAHGIDCFDTDFYLKKNQDLITFQGKLALWKHFLLFGQFEPRVFRYTCPMDFSKFAGLAATVEMLEKDKMRRNEIDTADSGNTTSEQSISDTDANTSTSPKDEGDSGAMDENANAHLREDVKDTNTHAKLHEDFSDGNDGNTHAELHEDVNNANNGNTHAKLHEDVNNGNDGNTHAGVYSGGKDSNTNAIDDEDKDDTELR